MNKNEYFGLWSKEKRTIFAIGFVLLLIGTLPDQIIKTWDGKWGPELIFIFIGIILMAIGIVRLKKP